MRRIVLPLLTLAVTVPSAGAPAPVEKPMRQDRRSDFEKLQGVWELAEIITCNGRRSTIDPGELLLGIEGNQFWSHDPKTPSKIEGRLTIVPTSEPKQMDMGSDLCIYRLAGDILTIRSGDDGERPSNFASPHPHIRTDDVDIVIYKRKPK